MAIGFADSSEKPLRLAIELHKLLNKYNKTRPEKDRMYLRIGIDTDNGGRAHCPRHENRKQTDGTASENGYRFAAQVDPTAGVHRIAQWFLDGRHFRADEIGICPPQFLGG